MSEIVATQQTILVVGGGISGMTAALEAAECGKQVILIEKLPTLGGRTALLYRYFPNKGAVVAAIYQVETRREASGLAQVEWPFEKLALRDA